ncbi:MAG: hypothetical protein HC896_10250 [Bacteroidales bacterium]|nr:hypothetical protein [Bacteroidales bacterium]
MKHSILLLLQLATFINLSAAPVFYTSKDGLPHNYVSGIAQDTLGFIWLATGDGLAQFDGYTFKTYKSYYGNNNGLGNYAATAIFTDRQGSLWVGTQTTLEVYDANTDSFKLVRLTKENSDVFVQNISQDANNNIWVATKGQGLFKVNPKNGEVVNFNLNPAHRLGNYVFCTATDMQNNVWAGSETGLYSLSAQNPDSFFLNSITSKLKDQRVKCILAEGENLWIGTLTEGAYRYSTTSDKLEKVTLVAGKDKENVVENVRQICRYGDSVIICTYGLGVYVVNKSQNKASPLFKGPMAESHKYINNFFVSRNNLFWAATKNQGIVKFDPNQKEFHTINNINGRFSNIVACFLPEGNHNVLVGTEGGGIYKYNLINNEISPVPDYDLLKNTLVTKIMKDKMGRYWFGTDGQGVFLYNNGSVKNIKGFFPF